MSFPQAREAGVSDFPVTGYTGPEGRGKKISGAAGGGAVDPRTTRLVETRNSRCRSGLAGFFGLLAESFEGGAARSARERRMVVSGGSVNSAKSMSSRPMTERSWGTRRPCHVGGAQNADGGHVVGADNRGGLALSACSLPNPATPPLSVWSHSMIHFFWMGSPAVLHGGAEVVLAGDGGVQFVRAGEESDLAMAEIGEMIERRHECRWSSRAGWCWPWDRRA